MPKGDLHFQLPGRVDSYLATLSRLYERTGEALLREIVVNGVVAVHEGWDYDNWNGGTYGHAITLTVSEDLHFRVMESKDDLRGRIAADINKVDNSQNEHVSEVFIEMESTESGHWREGSGLYRPRTAASSVPVEALQRIWGPEHVRVFLSHKSSVKEDASRLKQSLARCGIAAFVAHEDIEPTEEWQREIERALSSMDALVALLSEDYHDSDWTDQEAGVAIGRGVPLIPIRLGLDPYGLMGKMQGLGGCRWSDTDSIALKVFHLLHKRLPDKSRLFECALYAYGVSTDWDDSAWKVRYLLSFFEDVPQEQVARIVEAYQTNPRNRDSFKGIKLLQPLLEKWTGERWGVVNNELVRTDLAKPPGGEDISF
ncbi:MAG: toll/interleukin-1 receptor domain-containing protein [Planctomycetia bacterium]|nr:toll/interleukin-1 receptor domain-containing protein [Planctomycetia bacterium]